MLFTPSTGDAHLTASSALAAEAAGGLGSFTLRCHSFFPCQHRGQQSPLSRVCHLPHVVILLLFSLPVTTLIKVVLCLYQQQGLS